MLARTGRVFSVRAHVLLLVTLIVTPVLVLVGILLANVAATERTRLEDSMFEAVRRLATTLDRELAGLEYTLFSLANAPVLQNGDLPNFHQYIQKIAQVRDAAIVLRDPSSRVIVNSSIPPGEPVPQATSLGPADREAREAGRTVVSNLFTGLVVQRPNVAVVMPVFRNDQLAWFLSLSIAAEQIADVFDQATFADHQTGVIVDRNNVVVARSRDHDVFVGTRARLNLVNAASGEGRNVSENIEGERIHTFYTHSELSGWTVAISTPETALNSSATAPMQVILGLGAGLIGLSFVSALLLARQFSIPIERLAKGAAALGQNQPPPPLQTSVREIRHVWDNLRHVAEDLGTRTRERDEAECALRALNATLETTVATRTAELTESNTRLLMEMERREDSENQLRQVQKLEAIGQLTGGIAHDFNNMLAAILGGLQLIKRRLPEIDPVVLNIIEGVIDSTNRAAQLTRRLLAFARQQALSPQPADVNKLIVGMSELLRRSMPELVSMETVLAAGLWRVHVDANQLENAILNLAVNARDAMPEGGKLTIESANAYLDEAYADEHPEVSAGQYVLIALTDTGRGMTEEVSARAFDPFFTTKQDGQGTGLGLSQVHGFMKQSGGHVKIYSEPGAGTSVKLYLPRYTGPEHVVQDPPAAAEPRAAASSELILVVEDDDRVRAMTLGLLGELGHPTLEADGAVAALRLLDAHPEVKLLFTDVVMPGLNGRKLVDEARQRRPDLKVLFTTGYTRNAVVHNGILDPGVYLLGKPFTLEELAHMIEVVLKS